MPLSNPITPPIFVFGQGYISVYRSIHDAEHREEPQNFDGDSALFDSLGNRLDWSPASIFSGKYIEIRMGRDQGDNHEEFQKRLMEVLEWRDSDNETYSDKCGSLDSLMARVIAIEGFSRL